MREKNKDNKKSWDKNVFTKEKNELVWWIDSLLSYDLRGEWQPHQGGLPYSHFLQEFRR
ncbi:hypothetical protein J14TS2_22780 [Bacillus sp. J14TS2]|nr:hypothetical protein J14TS2_22780 [Bacillus sp. J14TS2]